MSTSTLGAVGDRPKFMSSIRRFGRQDNFKAIQSSTSSIGSKSIGKIPVDCQLLFSQSQWGLLGGRPGGIMYLNLHFGEARGSSRLQEATITIHLDEQDGGVLLYQTGNRPRAPRDPLGLESDVPVQFTQWFGPHTLTGEKKQAKDTKTTKVVPDLKGLGFGVGGVGGECTTKFTRESRWLFNGQLARGKKTSTYTTLTWHLKENDLDGQSFHNSKIHAAFAFEHSGQPFVIRLEIKGRLHNLLGKVRSKMKFGLDGAREGMVVTLVDFEDYQRFSRSLDRTAEGLPEAMEEANCDDILIELSDSRTRPRSLDPDEDREPLPRHNGLTESIDEEPHDCHEAFPTNEYKALAENYRRVLKPLALPRPRDQGHEDGKAWVQDSTSVDATGVGAMNISPGGKEWEGRDYNTTPMKVRMNGNAMLWGVFVQLFTDITTLFIRIWLVIREHIRRKRYLE